MAEVLEVSLGDPGPARGAQVPVPTLVVVVEGRPCAHVLAGIEAQALRALSRELAEASSVRRGLLPADVLPARSVVPVVALGDLDRGVREQRVEEIRPTVLDDHLEDVADDAHARWHREALGVPAHGGANAGERIPVTSDLGAPVAERLKACTRGH